MANRKFASMKTEVLAILKQRGFKRVMPLSKYVNPELTDNSVFISKSNILFKVEIHRGGYKNSTYQILAYGEVESISYMVGGNSFFGWVAKYYDEFEDWKKALDLSLQMSEDLDIVKRVHDIRLNKLQAMKDDADVCAEQLISLIAESAGVQKKCTGPVKKPHSRPAPHSRPKAKGKAKK